MCTLKAKKGNLEKGLGLTQTSEVLTKNQAS